MMDAIEPLTLPQTATAAPPQAGPRAGAALPLLRGLLAACVLLVPLLASALLAGRIVGPAMPVLAEARRSGVVALPLAALLLSAGGLAGTWALAVARNRALAPGTPTSRTRRRLFRRGPASATLLVPDVAIGRAARWPQVMLVAPFAAAACAIALALPPAPPPLLAPPAAAEALAGGAFALAFLLLLAERTLAAVPPSGLPEAAALRALAFLATLATFAAGLLQVASVLGLPSTVAVGRGIGVVLALVGAELALRALGRAFLPPPAPEAARAAVTSLLAALLGEARDEGGIVAPLRRHFGIDFARSWALGYVRTALVPVATGIAALAWALTGVVLVPQDGRAIAERFGAPVRVLHPGLHLILPWPLDRARAVEFGAVHELALTEAASPGATAAAPVGAEAPAPIAADRLWESAHLGEVAFLIASDSRGRQSFQTVSADLRVLWRVGLSDAQAQRAAYRLAAPEAYVRAAAGRVASAYFADRTLDAVLGTGREHMAEEMRAALQASLDAADSGLDAVAVVIEAVHPPAGAASAYHAVQAAEITATAQVSAERGRAAAALAAAAQYAHQLTTGAEGEAADLTSAARADFARFAADRQAAAVGGASFRLERYLAALNAALAHAPLTILDHRIPTAQAPTLDLRPLAGAASASGANGE